MKLTIIVLLTCFTNFVAFAQQPDTGQAGINWQNLDFFDDGVYGISMDKAYREVLRKKKPDTIIVAVIDTGIDTLHEDLRSVLWHNPREDGRDSDRNGYINDVYGWNFLGGANNVNLLRGSFESERIFARLRPKYENVDSTAIKRRQRKEYRLWLRVREIVLPSFREISVLYDQSKKQQNPDTIIYRREMERFQDPMKTRREIIGDNYFDFKDCFYGNENVMVDGGPSVNHGTHVAGIIGAVRDNNKGMNGVASAVKLMVIRAVPNFDEFDKDIALAIRYAVNNGAKIINMSFAKSFSSEKSWVDKAIRYAASRDVLIVNGAGNLGQNTDLFPSYPTAKYSGGKKRAPNMITVGASGPTKEKLIAPFSNYSKEMVDVFAPGINIYSTVCINDNGTKYTKMSGTSMAAPVATGLAAVLRSYYNKLTARQVRDIIITSVTKINFPVICPGINAKKVSMKQLCKSGGIVNAFNAVTYADQLNKQNIP